MRQDSFSSCGNSSRLSRQHGLSIVELMISIVLGLLLMAIIAQIYLGSKQTYRGNENASRLQENGRFILHRMGQDIRMAGYLGCNRDVSVNNIAQPVSNTWLQYAQAVRGYTASTVPTSLLAAGEALSGTDVVQIQGAIGPAASLTGNMGVANANVQINGNPGQLQADDILLIADCANADVFRATTVSTGSGTVTIAHASSTNSSNFLSKAYEANTQVLRFGTYIYYVGTGAAGCSANMLCRKRLSGFNLTTEELVDNVENMAFEYGEDTNGDGTPDRFVDAATVSNWANVNAMRLSLLLRSPEDFVTTTSQPYTFAGVTTTPGDRRLRRVFTTTVNIRNRTS